MADLVFVQGDDNPPIKATLTQAGVAVSLAGGATVKFQMRKADDRRYTVNAAATIVNATLGKVSYTWGANDLNVPGTYQVQWEITFPDTKIQTSTPVNTIEVRRQ